MREGICHGSLTLNCCFFPLLYPRKDFLHGFRATTPFHLLGKWIIVKEHANLLVLFFTSNSKRCHKTLLKWGEEKKHEKATTTWKTLVKRPLLVNSLLVSGSFEGPWATNNDKSFRVHFVEREREVYTVLNFILKLMRGFLTTNHESMKLQ